MGSKRQARAGCCVLALATLLLGARNASAASEPDIPPECGSRAAFDAELQKRLGDDAPLESIRVALTRTAHGFHLRVQIGNELRELLRAAVVVAVAMLLREHAPPPTSGQLESPKPEPQPSSSERPRFTLAGGAGVCAGVLPQPVLGFELESKALWQRWGLGLQLRYLTQGEKRDDNARGVRLRAVGGGLSGIFRPSRAWEARFGFAAQYLFGEGFGEGVPTFESRPGAAWAAGPTLGLGFVPLQSAPFWAGLGAEGQLNLLRGNFQIRNYSADFYNVPWLGGSAFVRLGLIW